MLATPTTLTGVHTEVKTNVHTRTRTLVAMSDERALTKERFLELIDQLTVELGSEQLDNAIRNHLRARVHVTLAQPR